MLATMQEYGCSQNSVVQKKPRDIRQYATKRNPEKIWRMKVIMFCLLQYSKNIQLQRQLFNSDGSKAMYPDTPNIKYYIKFVKLVEHKLNCDRVLDGYTQVQIKTSNQQNKDNYIHRLCKTVIPKDILQVFPNTDETILSRSNYQNFCAKYKQIS
ncbi:hypothetical protein TTHERM_000334631 (macronuclear) [Tetrahymena thermophila SB210]|uniref:Uncharacterized protein n=1 Tax=Tetrahymena thermophila (strain SB210) TaxID=312017 RepID=W7XC32_TETTS|nr:hypothetical protein TTHERM_000334631 [Tetrahymena thermophila SB210]EWS74023.1 hypothetical protein TTHERM_000334631 [Tetrahymena thermophila SB210]|eukprot:XP_012653422.1 hypothetical protein TTHERM_000334631 [Tetrahymena thermophila SB210]